MSLFLSSLPDICPQDSRAEKVETDKIERNIYKNIYTHLAPSKYIYTYLAPSKYVFMSLFLSITNKTRQNPQITARQLSTGQEKKKGGKRGDWEK